MASAVGDAAGPGCSAGDSAGIDTEVRGDANESEVAEGKVDITTPDKTNKICILVSY